MPTPTKSTTQILTELWELLQAYAKQETVDPLKSLGRYLGWGVSGSILLGLGIFFLSLSGLRALQSETEVFDGTWSWVPYLIVAVALAVVAGLAGWAGTRATRKEQL